MNHIELFGFAGSGKTSLLNALVQRGGYLGPKDVRDVRYWDNRGNSFFALFPKVVTERLGKFVWNRYYRWQVFGDFVQNNPSFVANSMGYIEEQHDDEETIRRKQMFMLKVMMQYELGRRVDISNREYCLSEGFYHKIAVSAKHTGVFPPQSYFEEMPKPRIIIHVDPSLKVLQKRRVKDQRRDSYTTKQLEEIRSVRTRLMDIARDCEIEVINVKNHAPPESVAKSIHSQISGN